MGEGGNAFMKWFGLVWFGNLPKGDSEADPF